MTNEYEVSLPIGDKQDYDMIVEKRQIIQSSNKICRHFSRNNQCKVGLRITGGNQSYKTAKKYTDVAFDLLLIILKKSKVSFTLDRSRSKK
jgi:hypothetical protein